MAEAWLIDVYAAEQAILWPSNEWYTAKWKKALAKRQTKRDVWHEFARLKPRWRTAILRFLSFKNEDEDTPWSLLSIEIPQRSSRTRLLGHKSDDEVVQVILMRRKELAGEEKTTKDPPKPPYTVELTHRPAKRSNASLTGGQVGDPANNNDLIRIEEFIHNPQTGRALKLTKSPEMDLEETRDSRRTEEIIIPRDDMNRPIEVIRPYGQEIAIREAPPESNRRSHRDEVYVRETSPPLDRERLYDSDSRRRRSHNAVAMFDRDRYNTGKPMPGHRRHEEKEEGDMMDRERPRSRERDRGYEDSIVRIRSKSRERDYENTDLRLKSDPHGRRYNDGKREAIFNRRDSERTWSRDVIPPPPPDLQREEYGRDAGGDLFTDETGQPRHKDSSHQQQLVIRRTEREPYRPRSFERRRPTIDQEIGSPSRETGAKRYIGSRDIKGGKPRRTMSNDVFDDLLLSRRTTMERPGPPDQDADQAIVRRTGGTRQVDGYMQDHVLDRSIRIRPYHPDSKQYEQGGRQQPIRRLLRSRMYSDSEDEDDVRTNYAENQASSEPKLTDEQLIARTLEKYTNLKNETKPTDSVVIPTSIESLALPKVMAEATTKTATLPDIPSNPAPQAAHKRSGNGPDSDESQRPIFEEVTDNGKRIDPCQAAGVIVEEPAVMTDEDRPTQDVRSDMAKRRARFADGTESSGIASNGYKSDPGRDSDGDLRFEEVADDRTAKAKRKRREARRLLREADDLSDENKEVPRESTLRSTPSSRSGTVEDTVLEHKDANGVRATRVVRARKPPISNPLPDAQSEVSSNVDDD